MSRIFEFKIAILILTGTWIWTSIQKLSGYSGKSVCYWYQFR